MMEYCIYCGEPVQSHYKYCPSCGGCIEDVEEFLLDKLAEDGDEDYIDDDDDTSAEDPDLNNTIDDSTVYFLCPNCGAHLTEQNVYPSCDSLIECPTCGNIFPKNKDEEQLGEDSNVNN